MGDLFTAVEAVQPSPDDQMLMRVLELGNIEALKEVIALRNGEQDRQARLNFEAHFAEMRSELPAIVKSKFGAKEQYKYAPLETIQRLCDPIIFRHGFSYSWREEAIPDGKRIWLDIVGYGHTQSNYFDSPQIDPVTSREGAAVQNLIQVRGVMSTYGRRYSFIAGFGLIIEGEDSDGQIPDDPDLLEMDLKEYIASGKLSPEAVNLITKALMAETRDVERLKGYWKRARAKVGAK